MKKTLTIEQMIEEIKNIKDSDFLETFDVQGNNNYDGISLSFYFKKNSNYAFLSIDKEINKYTDDIEYNLQLISSQNYFYDKVFKYKTLGSLKKQTIEKITALQN